MRGSRFVLRIERDPEAATSDPEGRPEVGPPDVRLRQGNLSMLSAREVLRAAAFGEGLTAAAHFASGEDVDRRDRVLLLDEDNQPNGVPPHLRGAWHVGAVRHTRPLVRALLRRDPLQEDDAGDGEG